MLIELKCYFEFQVLWVNGDFFDLCISYVAGKGGLYFPDAVVNICIRALGEHFHSTIMTIADEAGQLIAIGYVISGEAKADTLDPAGEHYMFGTLAHFQLYIKPSRLSLQVCILSVGNTQID